MASVGGGEHAWHNGEKLNTAAKLFHDRFARQPISGMDRARTVHKNFLDIIEAYLREEKVCLRIEFMGSSYEGVKVPKRPDDDDIEFDVLIVMEDGRKLQAIDTEPGYAQLKARQGLENELKGILSFRGAFGDDDYVDPREVWQKFFGKLQDCINKSAEMKDRVTLRAHGPAVQMDVYEDSRKLTKLYSVDIVPSFDIRGQYYIAKPFKNKKGPIYCWRKTFNIQEKNKLQKADTGNGCRKKVLRICKVIRNREPGLDQLSSYHLKTALFREMDWSSEWTDDDVGKRLIGVLKQLVQALERRNMPHCSIQDFNLLDGFQSRTLDNMRDRLARLVSSEPQMMTILNSALPSSQGEENIRVAYGDGNSWHNSDTLNTAATQFHDKYARQPTRGTDKARAVHTRFLSIIETYLRQKGVCLRVEFMGSTYEGVKVPKRPGDDDIEFDVLIVMCDGRKLQTLDTEPGCAQLKARQGLENDLKGILSNKDLYGTDDNVDAGKVWRKFFGHLQDCVNNTAEMRGRVKLRDHGPAVQMDVYEDDQRSVKMYSVDLVPSFDVGGQYFITKPFQNKQVPAYCWWKTFNIQEKNKLQNADAGNGCRKQVLRILKVIRNREPGLSQLSSYHLKTVLFREMDSSGDWTFRDVGKRLMGVLEQLFRALQQQNMPHYSIANFNLLDGFNQPTINNMRDRIGRLINSEHQMMAVLNS